MKKGLILEALTTTTHKLVHEDPSLTECEATVLFVQDNLVVTDRTCFYAESGGQVADQGWMDDARVVDVQKHGGRRINIERGNPYGVLVPAVDVETVVVHTLDRPAPFPVGKRVHLRIDWTLRYRHMRYHSAAHFLYQAVRTVYGRRGPEPPTIGCHIHAKRARFDYGAKLEAGLVPEVAALANDLIRRGHPIVMEADARTNEISYWRYDEVVIPCGGTHVRNAAEVGPVGVKRASQGKAVDRMYVLLDDDA
jgi:alanyl-tRNA synthetase